MLVGAVRRTLATRGTGSVTRVDGVVTRRRRVVRALLPVALVLLVLWAVTAVRAVAFPRLDAPGTADAVVVLGGDDEVGWETGWQLVRDGVADRLVVALPFDRRWWPDWCDGDSGGLDGGTVTCFDPAPSTTRGEAREIRRLARLQGWSSVVVVTWRAHAARSRMIVERCFDGDLRMVEDHLPMRWWDWVYEVAYQSGAWVKAQVLRGC